MATLSAALSAEVPEVPMAPVSVAAAGTSEISAEVNRRFFRGSIASDAALASFAAASASKAESADDFQLVSWQANDDKGDMAPDDFIAF